MSYNLAGLPAYVETQNFPLLRKSIFGAKTASLITIQPGVKKVAQLNIIDDSTTFQAGGGCTFNPIDTTTLSHRDITVANIKVDKQWCEDDLLGTYTQTQLGLGSYTKGLVFEEVWSSLQADSIAANLETAIWKGDTTSGNPNLSPFDGLLKIIAAASGVTKITGTTVAVGNVLAAVDAVYSAIPAAILGAKDLAIFVSTDIFRMYVIALKNANLFNYPVDMDNFELNLPAYGLKLYGVNGLNGTNSIVAARRSNLYLGVDLVSDSDEYKMWISPDNGEAVRMTVKFKAGTQIAFPSEIVYNV